VKLAIRVLKHVISSDVYREVVATHRPFVETLELVSEIATFHVEIQESRVIHQHSKRTIRQVGGGLAQNVVQNSLVHF
jgi:hypothetical protein